MSDQYVTPAGYRDTPYIYPFDPSTLSIAPVAGVDFLNNAVKLSGGEEFFLLRSIDFSWMSVGPNNAGNGPGGFNYGRNNVNFFSGPRPIINSAPFQSALGNLTSLPICPELAYAQNAQMFFAFYNQLVPYPVGSALNGTVSTSQLLFRGVRRYKSGTRPDPHDKYNTGGWKEESYSYVFSLNLNWLYWVGGVSTGGAAPLVNFSIPINDWDFELMDIRAFNNISQDTTGGGEVPVGIPCDTARLLLYDPYRVALMNAPVNLSALNSTNTTGPVPVRGLGAMCPSVVYPKDTQLQFEIQSLLSSTATVFPLPITIVFLGKRRWQ